jgi:threonine aldolase
VFNAAVALGVPVAKIAAHVDTMMFCLSKGLCAPIGSLLVGDRELIGEAISVRKYLGGSMRQAGIVAAAGILSLQTMVDRLADDHERAARLARGLEGIPGVKVDMESVQTNFVMLELEHLTASEFLERLKERRVWALPFSDHTIRFCTHNDIDDADVGRAIDAIAAVMKESAN